jgi:cyclopropane fatty-acyl-phospholipid synthase-like methyltransferase
MNEYYKIKDVCRQGLIKYLAKACLKLPRLNNHNILDIGCGSGVPTLWLSENFLGNITALDADYKAIAYLNEKLNGRNLQNRIKTSCVNFDEFKSENGCYNMILAEGFLNVVGFETGFLKMKDFLCDKGILVIHDEYKDHFSKLEFIDKNNFTIIDTLILNEHEWWNDYYRQLEREINGISDNDIKKMFKSDIEELKLYKTNPTLFQSIYYIVAMKT